MSAPIPNTTDIGTLWVIAGMTVVTIVTRAFFLIFEKDLPRPPWLDKGLQYAPIAALVAALAPEIFMTHGHMTMTWQDARIFATLTSIVYYVLRKGVLGTIVAGTTVYLILHLGQGW